MIQMSVLLSDKVLFFMFVYKLKQAKKFASRIDVLTLACVNDQKITSHTNI